MAEHASRYVGKTILVGITYLKADGEVDHRVQFAGTIASADEDVIAITRKDTGEVFTLPPDLNSIQPAPPGEYRLKNTGQIIEYPDFLCSWTVYPPKPGDCHE